MVIEVNKLKTRLKNAFDKANTREISSMLTRLERVQMTTTILEESQVGPVLVQLKKRPPGNEAKAKELAARAKALIVRYKSLFAVNVKPLQGVGTVTAGGVGGAAGLPSALVFLDSLEDAAAGPPVTNEPSPYDPARCWNGVDGCQGPTGRWYGWDRSVVIKPGTTLDGTEFAGPYTLPF